MIVLKLVGLQHALTFWTKVRFLSSFQLNKCGTFAPVGEFMTCPLFGMQRTALAVSTSNHPVLDIMALATSCWKPMYSFQSEDITCPACNGKHRPHTNKEGCKRFKGSEPKSAQVPKTAKSDSKKHVKKVIQPDSKLEVPVQPFDPDEEPMVASGPSSK